MESDRSFIGVMSVGYTRDALDEQVFPLFWFSVEVLDERSNGTTHQVTLVDFVSLAHFGHIVFEFVTHTDTGLVFIADHSFLLICFCKCKSREDAANRRGGLHHSYGLGLEHLSYPHRWMRIGSGSTRSLRKKPDESSSVSVVLLGVSLVPFFVW